MADTVTSAVIQNTDRYYTVHLTNVSDGTGESGVVKIDKSGLTLNGVEPGSLKILACRWAIQGFTSITLYWDGTTDGTGLVLSGNGYEDFEPYGGIADQSDDSNPGDILLTTAGTTAGNTYDITLVVRKET